MNGPLNDSNASQPGARTHFAHPDLLKSSPLRAVRTTLLLALTFYAGSLSLRSLSRAFNARYCCSTCSFNFRI